MIFLSVCNSDTCLFVQWRHNPYEYFDFCGGANPRMRRARLALQFDGVMVKDVRRCSASLVTVSKKINYIYIHRKHNIRSVLQRLAPLYTLFEHPFWGCLDGVMVKDVRRCSARRARRIRGFAPHRSRNIYMDYVSTVQKDKCRCYRLREIS